MWNTSGVEVNGDGFANAYASAGQLPPMIDGAYYGRYPWSHFEAAGATSPPPTSAPPTATSVPPTSVPPTSKPVPPTATPVPGQPCSPATAQGLSFTYNEAGEHCWTFSATPAYINSWNLNRLEVNGVDLTNAFGCGSHFEASD